MSMESITFDNDLNTFDDFGLMFVERPVFASPKVKKEFVSIPGSSSSLDFSETLTGYPTYEDRVGSFKVRFRDNGVPVRDRYTTLLNYLHGQRRAAVLSDELDWTYNARWEVGDLDFADAGEFADFDLGYYAEAYKKSSPRHYQVEVTESTDAVVTVQGSDMPVVPKFTVTKVGDGWVDDDYVWFPLFVYVDGSILEHYTLYEGVNYIPQLVLFNRNYQLRISRNDAIVDIDFEVGSL